MPFSARGVLSKKVDYPNFAKQHEAIRRRPSVRRALERDRQASAWLAEQGLALQLISAGPKAQASQ